MEFIDTAEALVNFCDSIKDVEWLALDTEFIREKTYYPKLCLIQIGIPVRAVCIDPLPIHSVIDFDYSKGFGKDVYLIVISSDKI